MKFFGGFVLYAIASGLNRGAIFLLMPILAFTLNARDYGSLSLFFVSSQLLVPLLTLNFSSVIARDVYEKRYSVVSSLLSFNCILLPAFVILTLLFFIVNEKYFLYVAYALIESFFIINSTYVRYAQGAYSFACVTFFKFFTLAIVFSAAHLFDQTLLNSFSFVVLSVIASTAATSIIYFWRYFRFLSLNKSVVYLIRRRLFLAFGVFLLPHVFSQWAISGLDKYVIKLNFDSEVLGVYAFGYSIASLYMLVNGALALYIPQICVKSNDEFESDRFYCVYFIVVTLVFTVFLICGLVFFSYYGGQFSGKDLFRRVFIPVSLGLYMLSFYYYYNSVVFYKRNIYFINNSTFVVGVITGISLLVFVPMFGILAASWITMFSYVLYFVIFSFRCKYMGEWRIIMPLIMLPVFYQAFLFFNDL